VPIEEIGAYIGARARLFPAEGESGASVPELFEMIRRNVGLALGLEVGCRWNLDMLDGRVRRVRTDNKLDRKEWLRLPDGRLIKCDALDHHHDHDLIGCQDPGWDLAGAMVEFDLPRGALEALVAAAQLPRDCGDVLFYELAYCAFRLGQAAIRREPAEAARLYLERLHLLLSP
jgi:hypothetical protein